MPARQPPGRGERILLAAGELLVRHGYRKVTMEDIAKAAKVGKGTVYLHWRTKEQLFMTLLRHEAVDMVTEVIAGIRADPAEVLPHRLMRSSFVRTLRNPLLTTMLTGDNDIFGAAGNTALAGKGLLIDYDYFELMTSNGLLRADIPHLDYAMQAVTIGFWLFDRAAPAEPELTLEQRADALARIIADAFEPSTAPEPETLATVAETVCTRFEAVIAEHRTWLSDA
ncbi:MAG TPA: helix-turn-helix domain-containing protein [Pseudonocardiaceae bacterium]